MNVVSIMGHQDDEMRCLGTLLKCRARGGGRHPGGRDVRWRARGPLKPYSVLP